MRKLITHIGVMTVLILSACLLCTGVSAEERGSFGDSITWFMDDSGVVTIEGTGALEGTEVYTMDWDFRMKELIIKPGITSIGYRFFIYCRNLEKVTLPETLTQIGASAFESCEALESLTVPEGVTAISGEAFSMCMALKKVTLPSSLTSIGGGAFSQCSSLAEINIPSGVKSIDGGVFSDCGSLRSIVIPDGVTRIGNLAFSGCSKLEEINIPDSVTVIETAAFSHCSRLKSVVIPQSVKKIGESVFEDCSSLTSVTFPYGLKEIRNSMFRNCISLTDFTVPYGTEKICDYAFFQCPNLESVVLPDSVTLIGSDAFAECESLKRINLPNSLTGIASDAFSACYSLKNITLPEGLKSISEFTFVDCFSLQSITIPGSVKYISRNAFDECISLKTVVIRDGVESIEDCAFLNCIRLESITIPDSVTYIGEDVFTFCDSLKKVTVVSGSYADKRISSIKGMSGHINRVSQITINIDAAVFPDASFRKYVSSVIDRDSNGRLTGKEIEAVTEIDLSGNKKIASLEGIELFKELESLNVDNNKLTRLDLKQNTKLKTLSCRNNQLTWLDLSRNKKLQSLNCEGNRRKVIARGGLYDLSAISGFNAGNAADIKGAAINGNLLTMLQPGKVTYTYDCGNGFKASFTLQVSSGSKVKITELILDQPSAVYTGKAIVPGAVVSAKVNGNVITLDSSQYKISFKNNTKPGSATVTVTGKGFFTGSLKTRFKIVRAPLDKIELEYTQTVYNGKAQSPEVTVTASQDGETVILKKGTHYTIKYKDNENAGTATVTVTGKGYYTGTITDTFEITRANLADVRPVSGKMEYTGSELKPGVIATAVLNGEAVILNPDTDYITEYENNTYIGKAVAAVTGTGNFTGTIRCTFKVIRASLKDARLDFTQAGYTGDSIEPDVTVKANDAILAKGTDYTVTYKNNVSAGTAAVIVKGIGNYKGTIAKQFTITPVKILKVSLSNYNLPYTGKARKPIPTVTTRINGQLITLVKNTDYTVKYENNVEIGTATVTITGKGNYAGTIVKTFKIK